MELIYNRIALIMLTDTVFYPIFYLHLTSI